MIPTTYWHGLTALGKSRRRLVHRVQRNEIFGELDVGTLAQQFNTLKQVPVSVARILVKNGTDAINHANSVAQSKNSIITGPFPGGSDRAIVQGKLQWHANTLAGLSDPAAMYASGDDLKKVVTSAYIESNAADEGAAWISASWSQLWVDIKVAIAALPQQAAKLAAEGAKDVGSVINAAASNLISSATGLPTWVVVAGGAAVLGLVGFGVYKILAGPTGGAIVGAYTRRRQ